MILLSDKESEADLARGSKLASAAEVKLKGGNRGAASRELLASRAANVSMLLLLLLLASVCMRAAAVADVAKAEALQLADQVGVVVRAVHTHLAAH